MSRIAQAFANKAKIAYLTANCGIDSKDYFLALIQAGVNILEIGIPFSDPVADGPSIQLAMTRAITNGTDTNYALELVRQIRPLTDAALIIFTYYNPICNNLTEFLSKAANAGVDGILVVDLPYEESLEFIYQCGLFGIDYISVAGPSTSLQRVELLSRQGGGFLYYACRKGTTGIRNDFDQQLIGRIEQVKQASRLPVAVGFGVSNNAMVKQILNIADGCVIGSYFVDMVNQGINPYKLYELTEKIFSFD